MLVNPLLTLGLLAVCLIGLGIWSALVVRSVKSTAYPVATLGLGLVFTSAFLRGLARRGPPKIGANEVRAAVTIVRVVDGEDVRTQFSEVR